MVMSNPKPAPGDLEHVQAFVNTVDIEEERDTLESPEALADWLRQRALVEPEVIAAAADLERAIALREALRAILLAHTVGSPAPPDAAATLEAVARRAGVRLSFDEHGQPRLAPEAEGIDAGLGRLLAIVHAAIAEGTWSRLKACRDEHCEWAFYDHTRNRSGTWCDMAVCGNRAKARAHRARRSAPERV
jgi:predicted RNA-binding Zn ribbon-like protein